MVLLLLTPVVPSSMTPTGNGGGAAAGFSFAITDNFVFDAGYSALPKHCLVTTFSNNPNVGGIFGSSEARATLLSSAICLMACLMVRWFTSTCMVLVLPKPIPTVLGEL
jgi:hypothetical protein